jgi:hypothetical protein
MLRAVVKAVLSHAKAVSRRLGLVPMKRWANRKKKKLRKRDRKNNAKQGLEWPNFIVRSSPCRKFP